MLSGRSDIDEIGSDMAGGLMTMNVGGRDNKPMPKACAWLHNLIKKSY